MWFKENLRRKVFTDKYCPVLALVKQLTLMLGISKVVLCTSDDWQNKVYNM